ncbi:hypothetical protein K7W42_19695 [Deinococcus sp. HMF7604]|uniref:hypothetical protein n=1 Tax=Deinococcus betulae TaxID=2873312 RepID=UPI001CCC065C|nr:hypothetical protein [Deinococcus betulae]MBZ9753065.1 hypothetical protein [Deinococcus betulae]
MTVPGLLSLGALLWAAWLGYGLWRWPVDRARLVQASAVTAVPVALLMKFTLDESVAWRHLTFPVSWVLWAALWLICLGLATAQHHQRSAIWPPLGVPVTGALALLLNLAFST